MNVSGHAQTPCLRANPDLTNYAQQMIVENSWSIHKLFWASADRPSGPIKQQTPA